MVSLSLKGHLAIMSAAALSANGHFIVSAQGNKLSVWDTNRGTCLTTLTVEAPLYDCAVSADGQLIVAAGEGGFYFLRLVQ